MHVRFGSGLAGLLGSTLIVCAAHAAEGPAASASQNACEALKAFHQPDIAIVDAAVIAAGQVREGGNLAATRRPQKPYCRVEARIEGNIGFDMWLPLREDWNGRLLGVGVGGDGGFYAIDGLARGVGDGFAAATTDTGHTLEGDPNWMMSRKKAEDYTHRSVHLTALLSADLAAAYYGSGPKKTYFMGCSGGGREALKEMERFYSDYDGIVAGAPASYHPVQMARKLWHAILEDQQPDAVLSDEDWAAVEAETIKQCDAIDGVTDGLVENPMACKFDVTKMACKPGASNACLTPAKVAMVTKVYEPFRDEMGVQRGPRSVPGIRSRRRPLPRTGIQAFGHAVNENANWDYHTLNIAKDIAGLNRVLPDMQPDETDLTNFARRGGKAIIYQGWLDPTSVASYTTQYYDNVLADPRNGGKAKVENTLRMFMAPNVYHCGGGAGPTWQSPGQVGYDPNGDLLRLVVQWVEQGKAPDRVLASKVMDGKVARTRPLCPYPKTARYKGKGSIDQAESFDCR